MSYESSGGMFFGSRSEYLALVLIFLLEGLTAGVVYFLGYGLGGILPGLMVADIIGVIYVFIPGIQSYSVLALLLEIGFILGSVFNGYLPDGNVMINYLNSGQLAGQIAGVVGIFAPIAFNAIVIIYAKIPDKE